MTIPPPYLPPDPHPVNELQWLDEDIAKVFRASDTQYYMLPTLVQLVREIKKFRELFEKKSP